MRKGGGQTSPFPSPPLLSHPFSFPSPPLPFPPLPFIFPSPPLPLEVGPSFNPARGSGERCKLPHRGPGQSPGHKSIVAYLAHEPKELESVNFILNRVWLTCNVNILSYHWHLQKETVVRRGSLVVIIITIGRRVTQSGLDDLERHSIERAHISDM